MRREWAASTELSLHGVDREALGREAECRGRLALEAEIRQEVSSLSIGLFNPQLRSFALCAKFSVT
jgi:hypothetical protein